MLRLCWKRGLTIFLYFDELNATRDDGAALSEEDTVFLQKHKAAIIEEITILSSGTRISGEDFYGSELMADAAERAKRRNDDQGSSDSKQ